jgi:hypothetical protein
MAFPANPLDQAQAVVNGITYEYSTSTISWTRVTGTVSGVRVVGNVTAGGNVTAAGNMIVTGNIYSGGSQLIPTSIQEYTATTGQTIFNVTGGYTPGTVQVFANGIALGSSDYTATASPAVVLNEGRRNADVIRIVSGLASSGSYNAQSFSVAMSVALG